MKTVISTPNAPGAIGPYSQGYAFGDLVITSGQIPVDPATGETAWQCSDTDYCSNHVAHHREGGRA